MAAGQYNLLIEQGATFQLAVAVTGLDLTGASAALQIRATVGAEEPLIALATPDDGLTIVVESSEQATIAMVIAAEATQELDFPHAVYDLEVTLADATVYRLLQGVVKLSPEVTR